MNNDDGDYKEFKALLQGLDTKLDLISSNLAQNHTKLETRVDSCEEDIDSLKNRPREDKINVKNEIAKTFIHWSIPVGIVIIIDAISSGALLNLIK